MVNSWRVMFNSSWIAFKGDGIANLFRNHAVASHIVGRPTCDVIVTRVLYSGFIFSFGITMVVDLLNLIDVTFSDLINVIDVTFSDLINVSDVTFSVLINVTDVTFSVLINVTDVTFSILINVTSYILFVILVDVTFYILTDVIDVTSSDLINVTYVTFSVLINVTLARKPRSNALTLVRCVFCSEPTPQTLIFKTHQPRLLQCRWSLDQTRCCLPNDHRGCYTSFMVVYEIGEGMQLRLAFKTSLATTWLRLVH